MNPANHINHVSIDLETFGLTTDAVLLQIAAAFVDYNGETHTFSTPVSIESQPERVSNPDTIAWWNKQSEKAKELVLLPAEADAAPTLKEALLAFSEWMLREPKGFTTFVWGNGAAFDLGMLNHAMGSLGLTPPWHYRMERDQRTLEALAALAGLDLRWAADRREGEHHDGASDAAYQARRITRLWQGVTACFPS